MKTPNHIYKILLVLFVAHLTTGCAPTAVVAGGATGAAVAYDRRTAGTILEDQAIETKAAQAYWSDKEMRDNAHINVTSYNMVVLVTGEAPEAALKERIINMVRSLNKVSRVYDEITIAAPSSYVSRSSDTVITSKVKTRLLTMDNFDGARVKVVTEKGVVYLMGLVSHEEADRVTDVVRQVGGVQKVVRLFQTND